MSTRFKDRISKANFEARVAKDLGMKDLSVSPYTETNYDDDGNPTAQRLSLYYKDGVHVGTWTKGEGWIFESAYKDAA